MPLETDWRESERFTKARVFGASDGRGSISSFDIDAFHEVDRRGEGGRGVHARAAAGSR